MLLYTGSSVGGIFTEISCPVIMIRFALPEWNTLAMENHNNIFRLTAGIDSISIIPPVSYACMRKYSDREQGPCCSIGSGPGACMPGTILLRTTWSCHWIRPVCDLQTAILSSRESSRSGDYLEWGACGTPKDRSYYAIISGYLHYLM